MLFLGLCVGFLREKAGGFEWWVQRSSLEGDRMGHRAGEEYWKVRDRDRFWEVIAQGGSLAVAVASVGVTRARVRWLRNGLIPEWCRQKIIDRVQPGTGPLTFVERGWIQNMGRAGFTTSEMARLLGRSRSTIWRSLSTTRRGVPTGQWRPTHSRRSAARPNTPD